MEGRTNGTARAHEREIAAEAVRWFEKLRSGQAEEAAQRREFARWLKRSPRNVHHFLFSTMLDRTLEKMDPERKLDVAAMLAEASAGAVPLGKEPSASPTGAATDVRDRSIRSKRPSAFRSAAGLAAILVVATLVGWPLLKSRGAQEYVTGVGEQRTVKLEDGSVLQLNTMSRIAVTFSRSHRDIRLREGEALFKVAPQTARPFRVLVEGNVIQALGTQFNVYRKPQAVMVAVLEGRVAVQADKTTVLSAGEEARVEQGRVVRAKEPDVAGAASWRQRRLVFRVAALDDVIKEFNRYNRAPKIRLEGLDGTSRHYTGTFDADDPGSLALLLSQDPTLSVERTPEQIVIRPR